MLLGSLRNDDGDGNESVISNCNFPLLQLFRDYSYLFNLKNAGELSRVWITVNGVKVKEKKENLLSCGHVLVKTKTLLISRRRFADDSKEMYQNVKRTCRAIVLAD